MPYGDATTGRLHRDVGAPDPQNTGISGPKTGLGGISTAGNGDGTTKRKHERAGDDEQFLHGSHPLGMGLQVRRRKGGWRPAPAAAEAGRGMWPGRN
ncbi:hypothetical protein Adu01nite_41060 [Paractinoplanes durhamensis]|uniref:Uncharacterized protein n=1 Tax=Paractinoplanes durhamensis TaxID=113563 RepID=A0ABQ3YYT8_9ACTN|nr:hypothetical protein Adu01nite_41060 [Actinoplanes durhamensis]